VLDLGFVANFSTVACALMVTRDLVVATTFGANILFCLFIVALTAHKRTSSKRKIGRTGEVSRKTAWHEKPSRGQNSPETNDRNAVIADLAEKEQDYRVRCRVWQTRRGEDRVMRNRGLTRTSLCSVLLNLAMAIGAVALVAASALAEDAKRYAPGISDTEIRIGQTMPYSGPASVYGQIGRAEAAYIRLINDQGGINGRKITLISLDDGYSPPKTVEQTRELVEREQVAFIFSSLGTAPNLAIRKYLNEHEVPQILTATGADQFSDPEHFPWTTPYVPSFGTEGNVYGKYILAHKPDARIAVLYQDDDFGKDLLQGLREGLGPAAAKLIVAAASYEVTDPTVDSQIAALQGEGADTMFTAATPKFAAQAIRKTYDIGWRPLHFLNYTGSAVSAVLVPAGLEKSVGLISSAYQKDPTDPQWQDDPGYKEWRAWMAKYLPDGNIAELYNVTGYTTTMMLVQVLRQCGDDLSRENIIRQATNMSELALPMLQPGIVVSTSPSNFFPVKQMRLVRFDGHTWVAFGDPVEGRLTQR
jgi:branched-chain amino acid transport system substrate-binding protein